MIKAYLNHNRITLKTAEGAEMTFPAGAAATGALKTSPYGLFSGPKAKISAMLDKIYASRHLSYEEQLAVLSGKSFSVCIETVNGKAAGAIRLKTADDLLALEMLVALKNGKPLKKCEHCGEYFIPRGRSDAVYCDRVGTDGFSCKKIGAHRQYRKNSRENDVKALYDKLTKHNRYLKNSGKISARDYDRWMSAVSESYAAFKKGDISEHALTTRLTQKLSYDAGSARREISDYLL